MAGDTVITVIGNLTSDPELRWTPSGAAVANFTIASTPRTLDRSTQEWKDGDPLFLTCTAWRDLAEHIAESLAKGTRVILTGRLRLSRWETEQGEKRSAYGLEVDEIGPSLRYATASVTKVARSGDGPRSGSGGGIGVGSGGGDDRGGTGRGGSTDPWAAPVGGLSEEPPF